MYNINKYIFPDSKMSDILIFIDENDVTNYK